MPNDLPPNRWKYLLFILGVVLNLPFILPVIFLITVLVFLTPITYSLWLLWVAYVNRTGTPIARIHSRQLQLPIVTYRHPTSGRRVIIVAAIHMAEADYFSRLQDYLNGLATAGYQILYERISPLSETERQGLDEAEQRLDGQLNAFRDMNEKMTKAMGLSYQYPALKTDGWVNTDMRSRELVRICAQQNVVFAAPAMVALVQQNVDRPYVRWSTNKTLQWLPALCRLSFLEPGGKLKEIILDRRNEIAFKGIMDHIGQSDVATIWGGAHLLGIEKLLLKEGFQEVSREWFTAYHIRRYTLWDCLRKAPFPTA